MTTICRAFRLNLRSTAFSRSSALRTTQGNSASPTNSSMTTTDTERATDVVVELAQSKQAKTNERPAHYANDNLTRFRNPWSSFRPQPLSYWFRAFTAQAIDPPKVPNDLSAQIPSRKPDWGAGKAPESIKATWLGHACYLVELPTPKGAARGPRILFDPVMSHRCSPVQWAGPERLTPTPCPAEEIPAVDAICISHNHYDHMDVPTLRTVYNAHKRHIFAPLGNRHHLRSFGIADAHIHILDWWEARTVSLALPGPAADKPGAKASFVVTCTPAQHTAGRTAFDRWHTLWSSWAVEEVLDSAAAQSDSAEPARTDPRKVYFAGDTGYRTVREGEDEDKVPRCPAFAEVGEKFGGFDLALLPIGAYGPRWMWSNLHASPSDAVQIFKDVRAKKALAMHWGTWILTKEPFLEPPALLKKECAKAGLREGEFDICDLGETRIV
ncbi:N-acyl-phosphatidylethanolamine-hydrolyzing phospholipase D [Cubamyces lactineus]|nr:N-acyl-phosphatidylethanolamine-hydrolyzing phospholipase D [Cubamyces lactineus]